MELIGADQATQSDARVVDGRPPLHEVDRIGGLVLSGPTWARTSSLIQPPAHGCTNTGSTVATLPGSGQSYRLQGQLVNKGCQEKDI